MKKASGDNEQTTRQQNSNLSKGIYYYFQAEEFFTSN
jgi:hypothetical protein